MQFLNDLLAQWGGGQTPWAQEQMRRMQAGGMPTPDIAQGPSPAMMPMGGGQPPPQMPSQSPMPRQLPAPMRMAGERNPAAPTERAPEPASPSLGTYAAGALRGAAQANNPLGAILGAVGGALGAGDQVNEANQTYRLLVSKGVPEQDAALAVKNPRYMQQLLGQLAQVSAPMSEADRIDLELKRAQLDQMRSKPPQTMQVNGRLVQIGADGKTVDITPESAAKTDPLDTFFGKEAAKNDFKTVTEYRTAADGAGELRSNLQALRAARSKTDTEGPIMGRLPALTSAQQQVDSASEAVRLSFVEKTKGAVSDSEMRIFGLATPGRMMTDEAANSIITGMDLAAQRTQERATFFDEWMRSKGTLNGAQAEWQRYANANPVIEKVNGQFVPRPENVGNWREFMSGQTTQRAGTGEQQAVQGAAPTAAQPNATGQNLNNPRAPGFRSKGTLQAVAPGEYVWNPATRKMERK